MAEIKEIELKIFLGNNCGKQKYDEARQLADIDDFELKNGMNVEIDDTYLDTKDLLLYKHDSYLRIRLKNGASFITVRIPNITGQIEEMTHSLGIVGVEKALHDLVEKRIITNYDSSREDFEEMLFCNNFLEILKVHNERYVKEIWLKELKIGIVKFDYYFFKPLNQAKFCEIEIDIYDPVLLDGIHRFKAFLVEFVAGHGFEIIKDNKSKYQRGIENNLFSNPLFYNK